MHPAPQHGAQGEETESPMLGVHDLPMFILAGLLLAMSPGPDTAYILGRCAQHGWRGGSLAALASGFISLQRWQVSVRIRQRFHRGEAYT